MPVEGLGSFLRQLREQRGLSVSAVQRELKCSRAYAYWLESEHPTPGFERLCALLDLYQATDAERLTAGRLRQLAGQIREDRVARAKAVLRAAGLEPEETEDPDSVDTETPDDVPTEDSAPVLIRHGAA